MIQQSIIRSNTQINAYRIVIAFGLLFLFLLSALWLISKFPENAFTTVFKVILGFVFVFIAASPYEWLVHRYVYHRVVIPILKPIYRVHHLSHHYVYFPTWRYVTGGKARRISLFSKNNTETYENIFGNALVFSMHYLFYFVLAIALIMIPSWLLIHDHIFLYGQVAGSLVVSNLFITVHDSIHRPGSHPYMESTFWFKFLDRHHYIHHVDTEANVNFLLPLSDWLFGTLRLSLTPEEIHQHGTLEQAKSKIIGKGEPAQTALKKMANS